MLGQSLERSDSSTQGLNHTRGDSVRKSAMCCGDVMPLSSGRSHASFTSEVIAVWGAAALAPDGRIERVACSLTKCLLEAHAVGRHSFIREAAWNNESMSGKTMATAATSPISTENYQHKFLFGDVGGKVMTPILATVFSRDSDEFTDFIRHRGQEFVMTQ